MGSELAPLPPLSLIDSNHERPRLIHPQQYPGKSRAIATPMCPNDCYPIPQSVQLRGLARKLAVVLKCSGERSATERQYLTLLGAERLLGMFGRNAMKLRSRGTDAKLSRRRRFKN